jgi:hypothetical protein
MDTCERLIIMATDTGVDRVTCSHPTDHSGWHLGTLEDGRQYEWTTAQIPARGRFVHN